MSTRRTEQPAAWRAAIRASRRHGLTWHPIRFLDYLEPSPGHAVVCLGAVQRARTTLATVVVVPADVDARAALRAAAVPLGERASFAVDRFLGPLAAFYVAARLHHRHRLRPEAHPIAPAGFACPSCLRASLRPLLAAARSRPR